MLLLFNAHLPSHNMSSVTDTLSVLFRACGWKWDDDLLATVARDLVDEGFVDICSLCGAEVGEITAADKWPMDVCRFVQHLVYLLNPLYLFYAVLFAIVPGILRCVLGKWEAGCLPSAACRT